MRRTLLPGLVPLAGLALVTLVGACDTPNTEAAHDSAPPPTPVASTPPPVAPSPSPPPPAPASTWDGSMPPRPVPKTSPTVGSGMSAETQMRAIAYMAAMAEPRFDDPNADADWAGGLAEKLRPITRSMDKGPADEKEKLNRVEVVGGGRKIDLLMAGGCDAETPSRAVVTRAGTPLSTLFAHGVLVVRCNDARVQCLQATRDPTDVLCTTAPRHR